MSGGKWFQSLVLGGRRVARLTPLEWSIGAVIFAGGTRWCSTSQRRRRWVRNVDGTSSRHWKLYVLRCCCQSPLFSVRNMFPSFQQRSRTQRPREMLRSGNAPFGVDAFGPSVLTLIIWWLMMGSLVGILGRSCQSRFIYVSVSIGWFRGWRVGSFRVVGRVRFQWVELHQRTEYVA